MEWLLSLDRQIFETLNSGWTCSLLDQVMPVVTDLHKQTAAPFVLVAVLGVWFWRQKAKATKVFLSLVLVAGVSDAVSYHLIKSNVQRVRPSEPEVQVVLRSNHHSGYSFPSNHAANMFAAATVLSGFYPTLAVAVPAYGFATLVAYSRVYVGVHYPLDVVGGAILGTVLALIFRSVLGSFRARNSNRLS